MAQKNYFTKTPLQELIAKKRNDLKKSTAESELAECFITDPYYKSHQLLQSVRGPTAISVETNSMFEHKCEWDENYPERPERLYEIINRISSLQLVSRSDVLANGKLCSERDTMMIHAPGFFEKLNRLSRAPGYDELEEYSAKYDAVYFSWGTHESATQALTCAVRLVKEILTGKHHNGLAIIRPPGHHAKYDEFCGYCFFNNVAIATQSAIFHGYAKKVMIVDIDVHHGDGIQRAFYNRKDVLYFSIHRYEHGRFWPNLREGNFDFIGEHDGKGFNVNVPINDIGLEDHDYLTIVLQLLLPLAYEFKPDIVVVAAGYDACIGCPEGQMNLSPGFYSHFIHLLSGVAEGRIAAILEGGYFLPSLSEGVAMTLKGLIGDPCPPLKPAKSINSTVIDTINNVKAALRPYWKCFSSAESFSYDEEMPVNHFDEHVASVSYFGQVIKGPYPTRNCYTVLDPNDERYFEKWIEAYQSDTRNFMEIKNTGYCFDHDMLLHKSESGDAHEKPERVVKILELIDDSNLSDSIRLLRINPRNDYQWCLEVHDENYMDRFMSNMLAPSSDLYFNRHTPRAALTSVEVLLTVVDYVLCDEITNGVAIIRPPGHHATFDAAQGFCFINNIAVAAKYALKSYSERTKRIMIVDFDVHHGNGTQDIFYNTDEVLYISIHRFDRGHFYPSIRTAGMDFVGHGPGEGYNVNIPFSGGSMGDSEYLAAFLQLILPIGYSYKPDLVLVSAGFDAGVNDPLGGYKINPETFGHFVYLLKPLALGRVIVALEGGYNVNTTAYSMLMCMKALKGQPIPISDDLYKNKLQPAAVDIINKVIRVQRKYWPVLNVNKKISDEVYHLNWKKKFEKKQVYYGRKFEESFVSSAPISSDIDSTLVLSS